METLHTFFGHGSFIDSREKGNWGKTREQISNSSGLEPVPPATQCNIYMWLLAPPLSHPEAHEFLSLNSAICGLINFPSNNVASFCSKHRTQSTSVVPHKDPMCFQSVPLNFLSSVLAYNLIQSFTNPNISLQIRSKKEAFYPSYFLFLLFVGSLDIVGCSRVENRDPQIHVNLLPHSTRLDLKHKSQSHLELELRSSLAGHRETGHVRQWLDFTLWQPPRW